MTPLDVDPLVLARLRQVGGDELVLQIISFFLRTTPQRLQILHDGVTAGDLEACERAAHALQSSAGNVGARQVQIQAAHIEHSAEVRELAVLSAALTELDASWERAQVALQTHLALASAAIELAEAAAPAKVP
jgi:HPt (histidine-containing phosphotransfer) domain-containing protein